MARFTFVRRVMIAAPSDASDLVKVAFSAIDRFNQKRGHSCEILEAVNWIKNVMPGFNPGGGQAEINDQIVDSSDLLIAIFRNRLGTATAKHESGTVEEIKRHIASHRPAMVYFSGERLPKKYDKKELRRLKNFKNWCKKRGG